MTRSLICSGWVEHRRLSPRGHAFRTPVSFMAIDLNELPGLDRDVKGFGFNRFQPVSVLSETYLRPGTDSFEDKLRPWLRKLDLEHDAAHIILVTSARWLGKVFNPVSFYLIRNREDKLIALISEVNNTFGDRHVYPTRLEPANGLHESGHEKEFHVSPFNDMHGQYRFTVREEKDSHYIGVDLYKQGEKIMVTWIEGPGVPLTTGSLWRYYLRHPLRPWLTMPRIVWQAALLRFLKKLTPYKRPEPSHPHTLLSRGKPKS